MSDTLPSLEDYARGRRGRLREFAESKVGSGLIITVILFLAGMVSGVASLPARVEGQDRRLTVVEAETRTLRESGIRRDEQFAYIKERLDELVRQRQGQRR